MKFEGKRLVATYTAVHGVAEFLAALTLFSMLTVWTNGGVLVLTYSVLAFGCPLIIALVAYGRLGRIAEGQVGLVGTVLMAAGMMAAQVGWVSVVLLGLGSATLHIAAGTATLKLPRGKGTAVGVFESTGAVGLALGGVMGAGVWQLIATTPWILVCSLAILVGGVAVLIWGTYRDPVGLGVRTAHESQLSTAMLIQSTDGSSHAEVAPTIPPGWMSVLVLSGLAVISVIRSVSAFTTPQPWKQGTGLVMGAAVMVMLGRAVGGVLVDRWGFAIPSLAGFLGAGLFFSVWPHFAWAGLAGVFFLALPMAPVIVAMVAGTGRPSLAFGLAQFFQVPAALATGVVANSWIVFATMLSCAVIIVIVRSLTERKTYASI